VGEWGESEVRVVRSMTGFGEASAQVEGIHYLVEVRSLNNKYFKATIRLPEVYQALEAEFEAELRRRVTRGSVTMTASCTAAGAMGAHTVNHEALEHYIQQLRLAPAIADGSVRLDVSGLLTLPGVLQAPADEEDRLDRARRAMLPLLQKACDGLLAMREREGKLLREELRTHRALIADRLAKIAERSPTVVNEYENRLRTRIEMMVKSTDIMVNPADLIREIAVYAERTDIAEEISRLTGHIEQFEQMLVEGDDRPLGRTLEFLSQEMLREANTIASKSPDAGISRLTVEVKGAIDRIKEQVQNVE
jgi:uncharacterized protein (TIGR00255 family)